MGEVHSPTLITVDVVYIVGPGPRPWIYWSLRSLQNLAHDRVWVAGELPGGLRNVSHISVAQTGTRYANSTANVAAACEHPRVSDPFLLFNDDFFILEPLEAVPVLHNGPVPQGVVTPGLNGWHRGMLETRQLMTDWGIPEPLSYELHVPLVIHKGPMADVIRRARSAGIAALHKRSLYGNVAELGGSYAEDPKLHGPLDVPKTGDRFVSTSTTAWTARAGDYIRAAFPELSPYETPERRIMPKTDTITIDELTVAREFDKASGRTVKLIFRPGEKVDRKRAEKLGIVKKSKKAKANDGNVDDLLEKVGDDAEAAAEVLEAEQAEKKPRSSLVKALEAVIAAADDDEANEND